MAAVPHSNVERTIGLAGAARSAPADEIRMASGAVISNSFRPIARSIASRGMPAGERLRSLRAVILLDGTVRRSAFAESIDQSILELPLTPDLLLMYLWREQIAELGEAVGVSRRLPCRIVLGRTTSSPS